MVEPGAGSEQTQEDPGADVGQDTRREGNVRAGRGTRGAFADREGEDHHGETGRQDEGKNTVCLRTKILPHHMVYLKTDLRTIPQPAPTKG